jgi:hypothetical protein
MLTKVSTSIVPHIVHKEPCRCGYLAREETPVQCHELICGVERVDEHSSIASTGQLTSPYLPASFGALRQLARHTETVLVHSDCLSVCEDIDRRVARIAQVRRDDQRCLR